MIDAAVKALSQILSPSMRAILFKAVGLALALIVVAAVVLHRVMNWFATSGEASLEGWLGPAFHAPLTAVAWIVSIAAGLGIVFGAIMLMPSVSALVASIFVDDVAEEVERAHYPAEPLGRALPLPRALIEGGRTAIFAALVYLLALPFLLVAGAGFVIFFLATAYLLGREYFELAAMRFRPVAEAKMMRRRNAARVFTAGLVIAAFVSIPIVNLATPLFAMAFMVHIHKQLSGPRPELLPPETTALPPR